MGFLNSKTLLREAAKNGDLNSVDKLLKAGADPNSKCRWHGATPLDYAVDFETTIDWEKKLTEANSMQEIEKIYEERQQAIRQLPDRSAIVERLLAAGSDVNATTEENYRALYCVAHNGHAESLRVILQYKNQNVDKCVGLLGAPALTAAVSCGHLEIARTLLKVAGAKTETCDNLGGTAFIEAAGVGDLNCMSMLLDAYVDINASTTDGATALTMAALWGHVDVVDFLLQAGFPPDSGINYNGAINIASAQGDLRIVRLLIRAGATLQTKEWSALLAAEENGHQLTVKALLAAGAKPKVQKTGYSKEAEDARIKRNDIRSAPRKTRDIHSMSRQLYDNANTVQDVDEIMKEDDEEEEENPCDMDCCSVM